MPFFTELIPSSSEKRAILGGVLVSLGYTTVIFWYSIHSTDITMFGPFWQLVGLYSLAAFGTIGVPLALWIRNGICGPTILMALLLLFWHVLVYLPPFEGGTGDTPGFTFVFLFVPFYLIAYGLLAGGEYWLRDRFGSGMSTAA